MSITSYRLYCDECPSETVVRGSESARDTHWSIGSLINHTGLCPFCNPQIDIEEVGGDENTQKTQVPLTTLDAIGEQAAKNLTQQGYDTHQAITTATDTELLDVSWVGQKGLSSLREAVE